MQKEKQKSKNLKTITLVIALVLIIVAMHSCYKDRDGRHFRIPYKNNSERMLYVDFHIYWPWYPSIDYLDTVVNIVDPRKNPVLTKVEPKSENLEAMFKTSFYESGFGKSFDTLIVFAFDADTLDYYGWDTVCAKYKVLQRYDLSLEDLQDLDFKLCFPPSEAMEHIHMWPPYGTYDENGNIIEGRGVSSDNKHRITYSFIP